MKGNQQALNIGIFALLALTWGSSFILMKKGLESFDGVQVALLRICFALMFILAIGWRKLKNFQKKDLPAIMIVGFLGNGFPYILFAWGLMHIDSSIGGITNSLTPLFTLVVGAVLYKIRIRPLQLAGIALGLFGTYYMIDPANNAALGENWPYALLTIGASMMYAFGVNTISAKLQHYDSITITALALTVVGPLAIVSLFLFTDFTTVVSEDPDALNAIGFIAILGVMGTGFAIILFNYLIKKASQMFAVSITYVVPIVALGWGVTVGEEVTAGHIIGIIAILSGVYLVNARKMKKAAQ